MSASAGFAGKNWFLSGGGAFNTLDFVIRAIISGKSFASLVQVKEVTNAGGLSPVGMLAVQPMVDQVDGFGNRTSHGTVYNIPYFRLQGGANAVIIDPAVGDIGAAIICDRDISTAKATKEVSGPGSLRQHDKADGLYLGGYLNGVPTQFIQFEGSSVNITATSTITITAPSSVLLDTPSVNTSGNLVVGNGFSGSFSTSTGQVVTVSDGIVTNIE